MIFPRHGANICAPVATDFRFITHTTQGHADKFAPRRLGDGLAKGRLADSGRADQAQDGSLNFADSQLYRQILQDAFLDLFPVRNAPDQECAGLA